MSSNCCILSYISSFFSREKYKREKTTIVFDTKFEYFVFVAFSYWQSRTDNEERARRDRQARLAREAQHQRSCVFNALTSTTTNGYESDSSYIIKKKESSRKGIGAHQFVNGTICLKVVCEHQNKTDSIHACIDKLSRPFI